ncbi:molybdopterin adenylyltransferase [Candidatus Desulforudis audaxviator]|uniref:Molybdenum cofactor synthesis domain n=1 Tax=Desulforudis audaxviator (strain MP104C) TaxID=477974 RepID=B1I5T6_DESAP|nr:molybdopterin adenylyltransferase [Candidatus Desulforudis audaxviator]ACA60384.1 molybdenum cofactor synthesis domain [Candidatus Desulforudis audaxviator MP104C]AZK60438.1 Molybdenum cofactor biosynthesis protein MoaB [Candidatus Desulforudis audaxviator]
MFRVAVVTASDKGSRGEREDESGRVIEDMIVTLGWELVDTRIVPDDIEVIIETLVELCDDRADLVLTTGGTGFALRDNTPEATLAVVERQVPGLAEAMRAETSKKTPRAILSRGVAGIRKRTLIVNLPGSPKAVRECLEVILPALPHGLEILTGRARDCARN